MIKLMTTVVDATTKKQLLSHSHHRNTAHTFTYNFSSIWHNGEDESKEVFMELLSLS